MFSYVVARIKPQGDYQWYTYTGSKPFNLLYRGNEVEIKINDIFGVRPSASKKEIRLVIDNDITRVITLTLDQARKLAKFSRSE